ncbi:AMP-binding protein [Yinghuangia sp. ASG 101]|uniref:class I adenylate-forming enzyme family protein n=1 Tax=Yinghuangia sp. ASG 101 TaxID=2896848 RepID=UPI001E577092|nr:AMP-binding protein [Yinghuangia sp. ASG 101]UGQ14026.1 AMP-binding protein [Yinghuangia sp. ASG 101]
MGTDAHADTAPALSIASGPPLGAEPGLGTLTLPGFLREVTRRYGDREAVVLPGPDGGIRWTYADLWERTVEVARALRACGVGKGSRVGVLMTNRPEWIASVFGTTLAGGVAVTISTFSTPSELDHMLRVSGVSVLLFERGVLKKDFADVLTELEPGIGTAAPGDLQSAAFPHLRRVAMIGEPAVGGAIETWSAFLARGADQPRELVEATADSVEPSDAAVLFFSSGSTSRPKGILSAHRGVAIQLWRMRRLYGFSPDDHVRSWTANGLFWSGNFAIILGGTLASGGAVILQRTFSAPEALEFMQAERVNFPFAWPHQCAQLEGAPNWLDVDLGSIRFADVTTSFTRHPTVTSDPWLEPGHAYGNTETFTLTTGYPANTPDEVHQGSYGRPLPGVTVAVADPLTGAVLPLGERGEICIKSPTLMLGYVGIPLDETLDSDGFFHTGDGGYLDADDRLFWEGRLTDIIKTGGANVSPLEVDEALIGYPGVKVVRTVGVPHETLGEIVVSCIVPHENTTLEPEPIRAFLKERLASYKVPRRVLFFREDEIEMTGTAKVKTADLRELAAKRLQGQEEAPAKRAPA